GERDPALRRCQATAERSDPFRWEGLAPLEERAPGYFSRVTAIAANQPMAEPAERPAARVRWLLLGAAAVVLVIHSLAYHFVTDDAYIPFVYARNLAEHGELSFNLGQPVEGYTNFLWTFVLGLGMLARIPPEWSSQVLGTACGLATLVVAFRIAERALGRRSPWAAVPALLLACSSGFACWTSGG